MYNFLRKNNIFWAVIIGAIIIGGCLYLGLSRLPESNRGSSTAKPSGQNLRGQALQSLSPQLQIKNNSVAQNPGNAACGAASNTIVTKVIDGDTVVVEGGWHVRLLGMDADEKGYPCYDPARIRLEDLVLAKQVVLEKDVSDVDQYGRCLRYIFLGTANIDVQLVKEGLAVARFYKLDIKYQTEITLAEQYAEQNKIGCKWSGASQTK